VHAAHCAGDAVTTWNKHEPRTDDGVQLVNIGIDSAQTEDNRRA